jgi:hypothetical protein
MHIQPDCPYRCLERIERKATILQQGMCSHGVLKVHSLTVSVLLDCDKQNLTSKLAESCSAQEALHAE